MSDWAMRVYEKSCEDMSEIPDRSIQTCVTSPPYYGLRDYGTGSWSGGDAECGHIAKRLAHLDGTAQNSCRPGRTPPADVQYRAECGACGATRTDEQIGLEPSIDEYVARLVGVFREVRRVLRDDGTLWLNLGDSYTGTVRSAGLKPKDLIGVPWRVAFALQADGWYLRSDIIWHKPNPMPSSVTDRCTSAHEYVFMLSKSARYFFDGDAIKEPISPGSIARLSQPTIDSQHGSDRAHGTMKSNGPMNPVVDRNRDLRKIPGADIGKESHASGTRTGKNLSSAYAGVDWNEIGANKRDVWTIGTEAYSDAHFATFPRELPSLCVRAGTSEAGCCAACGASRVRIRTAPEGGTIGKGDWNKHDSAQDVRRGKRHAMRVDHADVPYSPPRTIGFEPSCKCEAPTIPSVVLDPFMGSGTTAEVAESLGRRWVGYELNPEYHALIAARTRQTGIFTV